MKRPEVETDYASALAVCKFSTAILHSLLLIVRL